jgi:hypothetical protein
MNAIARIELACARFVEEAFARVFPSELDAAQVGRKLVAVMQATPSDTYLVRVHPHDYARFADDRDFLEARWSALLRDALPADREEAPRAILHEDDRIVSGSLAVEAVTDETTHAAKMQFVWPDGSRTTLRDGMLIGRASDNDIVIPDGRASRRHARIFEDGGALWIADTGSSNGTFLDGAPARRAQLVPGATVSVGDCHLKVVADGN